MITFFQALILGIWYWMIDYGLFPGGYYTFYRPLVTGAFVGIVLGNIQQGVIIGAYLNMVFIGSLSVGGAQSNDPALASILGTALAIASGLEPEVAATIAIPIALAGNLKNIFLMTFDSIWVHFSLPCIERGDRKGLVFWNNVVPQAVNALLSCLIIVPACLFGVDAVTAVVNNCPEFIVNSLSVVGGLLPCLGIALTLNMIGSGSTLPFFFLGFILTQYMGLDMIAVSALGAIVVALKIADGVNRGEISFDFASGGEDKERAYTNGQMNLLAAKYLFQSHLCYQYERLQGVSFAQTMGGVLKKFYPNDEEKFVEEWQKYKIFYNTDTFIGSSIFGITVAMEEEKANGAPVTAEAINTIRTSLMGPMAGIGDALSMGAIMPITSSICLSMALADGGTLIGPILNVIINHVIFAALLFVSCGIGYRYGRDAIASVMGSGLLDKLTEIVGSLGCMVLGAMACQFVSVTTNVNILLMQAQNEGGEDLVFNLQRDLFDPIFKGLVPLFFVMLTFWLIKKKQISVNKVLIILLIISLIGGGLGFLTLG